MHVEHVLELLTAELKREVTLSELATCVAYNPKGRFRAFWCSNPSSGRVWLHGVSACSSHSIPWIDPTRVLGVGGGEFWDAVSVLCHGTKLSNLLPIFFRGLVPGGGQTERNDIHLSPFAPWDTRFKAGCRFDADTHIFLDLEQISANEVPLFSQAGAVLISNRIPGVAFDCVTHWRKGYYRVIWHRNLVTRRSLTS